MNQQTRRYAHRARLVSLLATASLAALASTPAKSQNAGGNQVEEVLVTGSLIRGAPAVGVPVTALSEQDFRETGALTISDMLKGVPALTVQQSNTVTNTLNLAAHPQSVSIHGLNSASATETLLMIDGMRFPVQSLFACYVDPSVIPQLAVDHIDVLADGASATYGSDAIAGVVNVLLKHGFEGAISQVRYARSWDLGGDNFQATQLYGRKWNSGDVTVSYEWYHEDNTPGPGRAYFTMNYEPYGFDDKTPIGTAMPGVLSTGPLFTIKALGDQGFTAALGARACANCYTIPSGTGWNYGDTPAHTNPTAPGSAPTTTWTALLANPGVKSLRNPNLDADILPSQDHNSATLTFDQDLIYGIKFFGDAFHSNRRSIQHYPTGAPPSQQQPLNARAVPTTNPYYPAGAPAGLRISYDLGVEHNSRMNAGEVAERYDFGFTSDLPFDWHGRVFYSMSEDGNYEHISNMVNLNMVSAALGNTVPAQPVAGSQPGQAAFVKPANVPYLNVFCDATVFRCNSQITEDYISAYRDYDGKWQLGETGVNLDGPVTELPGGTVRAAIGANAVSNHSYYAEHSNFNTVNTSVPVVILESYVRTVWAVFGQLNVPLVGEMNKIPLVEGLNVELAYRYDRYYDFGGVTTPKLAATWNVGHGLSLRGTVGKSFRAPEPGELSAFVGATIVPDNIGGTGTTLNCASAHGSPVGQANLGTLNNYLNPNCNPALANPGGIIASGGGRVTAPMRSGALIGPEKGKNWALGFNFKPTDFLPGLNLDATWYHIRIDGLIANNGGGVGNPNDPLGTICTTPTPGCLYFVRANPNLPITDPANAVFLAAVNGELLNPKSTVDPSTISAVQYIQDTASTNVGWREISGIDFDSRYDFDLGDWGAWNVGVTGNYRLKDVTQVIAGTPTVDVFAGQNSGGRLKYRGRLGWAGSEGASQGLNITAFVNFIPHSAVSTRANRNIPPSCYWSAAINPATLAPYKAGDCYPGSPFFGPYTVYPARAPGLYTFDLAIGYQTGTKPANTYLQNLNFQLTVNDLFNKAPPFYINFGGTTGPGRAAFVEEISPQQRYISFSITKAW